MQIQFGCAILIIGCHGETYPITAGHGGIGVDTGYGCTGQGRGEDIGDGMEAQEESSDLAMVTS